MQKIIARLLVTSVLSVGILTGCSSKDDVQDPLTVDRPADQIFKEADSAEKDGNYKKASTLYGEVERQHPYSDYATLSQLRQAEAAYRALKYDDAIVAIDRFVELHPGHEQVPYAYYMKAMCYYEQMTDVARDQAMTRQALEALDTVINRFPDSKYARDAQLKLDLVLDHLAGKEMEIGRFYQRTGQWLASQLRFQNVVEDYQTTSHTPEALYRLTESSLALGIPEEAQRYSAVLGANYPGSEWYEKAFNLMQDHAPARVGG